MSVLGKRKVMKRRKKTSRKRRGKISKKVGSGEQETRRRKRRRGRDGERRKECGKEGKGWENVLELKETNR